VGYGPECPILHADSLQRKPVSETVSWYCLLAQAASFSMGLATTLALLGVVSSFLGQAYGQIGSGFPVAAGCLAIAMGLNLLNVSSVSVFVLGRWSKVAIDGRVAMGLDLLNVSSASVCVPGSVWHRARSGSMVETPSFPPCIPRTQASTGLVMAGIAMKRRQHVKRTQKRRAVINLLQKQFEPSPLQPSSKTAQAKFSPHDL